MIPALVLAFACHQALPSASPAPAPTVEPDAAPAPSGPFTAREKALIQALTPREPEPDCATVLAGVDDPTGSLIRIAEGVPMPPWVSSRAAACLCDRAGEPAAETAIARWVSSAEWAGLGLLAVNLLDRMPPEVAERVAEAALEGPIADQARDEIGASTHASVRALVAP